MAGAYADDTEDSADECIAPPPRTSGVGAVQTSTPVTTPVKAPAAGDEEDEEFVSPPPRSSVDGRDVAPAPPGAKSAAGADLDALVQEAADANATGEVDLDAVTRSPTLNHMTLDRPKGPADRRPPTAGTATGPEDEVDLDAATAEGAAVAGVTTGESSTDGAEETFDDDGFKAADAQTGAAAEPAVEAKADEPTAESKAAEPVADPVADSVAEAAGGEGAKADEPATEPASEPAAEQPAALARLALTTEDLAVYTRLWGNVQKDGLIGAKAAVTFLQSSTLPLAGLRKIWSLSDSSKPKGSLSEDEFFTALKLVALAQAKQPVALENLGTKTPLPNVTGVEPDEVKAAVAGDTNVAEPPTAKAEAAQAKECPGFDGLGVKLGLTQEQYEVYCQKWNEVDTDAGFIGAGKAVAFFQTSKLPMSGLKLIWGMADAAAPKGKLDVNEFFVALKLIALAQNKLPVSLGSLPKSCPLPSVGAAPEAALKGDATTWKGAATAAAVVSAEASQADPEGPAFAKELNLSASDVEVYKTLWSEVPKTSGFVAAGNAVKFLQTSKLPTQQLRGVWTLSDTVAPKGKLSEIEFYRALKFVALAQAKATVSVSNLGTLAPLPKVGSTAGAKEAPKVVPKAAKKPPAPVPAKKSIKPSPKVCAMLKLSEEDANVYGLLWGEAKPEDNAVKAASAVKFLQSSGLPTQDLRKIWMLTAGKSPTLGKDKFFLALKFVALAQAGKELAAANLPIECPAPKLGSQVHATGDDALPPLAAPRKTPAAAPSGVTDEKLAEDLGLSLDDVAVYRKLWIEVDTTNGYVSAGVAVKFLQTSRLPQKSLHQIWSASDRVLPKGRLGEHEFCVALKLIALAQKGSTIDVKGLAESTPLPRVGSQYTEEAKQEPKEEPMEVTLANDGDSTKDVPAAQTDATSATVVKDEAEVTTEAEATTAAADER